MVIDADGLNALVGELGLVNGYKKCILTPNFMEFKRLYESTVNKHKSESYIIKVLKSIY